MGIERERENERERERERDREKNLLGFVEPDPQQFSSVDKEQHDLRNHMRGQRGVNEESMRVL